LVRACVCPSSSRDRYRALAPASAAYFKAPARGKIVAKGYTIVMNVGDQWSDLLGGYAERTFKLANPFYVIP
jgi:HAD superfamily, subfamily IIIB (Acid phosphatase)